MFRLGRSEIFLYSQKTWLSRQKILRDVQKIVRTNSKFSKDTGYNVDIRKSIIFLYTSKKHLENKSNRIIPFMIEQIEYGCSRLCIENHKTFLRDIKEDLDKWMATPCLRSILLKYSFIDLIQSQWKLQQTLFFW